MKMIKIKTIAIAVVTIFLFALSFPATADELSNAVPVVAMRVTKGTISSQLLTTGEVVPKLGVNVHPDVGGQIEDVLVSEGSLVKKGQIMVQIDNQVQKAQLEQAEAAVSVARAAVEMQKVLVKSSGSMLKSSKAQADSVQAKLDNLATTRLRLAQLYNEGAISKQQLDDTVASHDATKAQMKAAAEGIQQARNSILTQQMNLKMKEAQLVQALANRNSTRVVYNKTTIKAAFDGIVTTRFEDPGAMANPAKPLLRVEQMDPVKIVGSIIEKDIGKIIPGKTLAIVKVDSLNKTFEGVIEKIYPTINATTRTGKLEVIIKNPEYKLCSGMFAQIKLLLETRKDIIVVPRDILLKHNGKSYSYVIRSGKAIKQEVKTGIIQDTNIEIKEGLKQGDEVISEGLEFIKEGSTVKPVFAGVTDK